jgi:site-specific DNA-cytosine methylase
MKVLSLFDGISCAYEACERAGIKVDEYYACEIEPNAIKVSQTNHPDIIRPVNDVRFLSKLMLPEIDLLIGGSPCSDLSIAKKNREGLEGKRSGLFWEYVRILKEVKPKYFVLENVASMPSADRDIITREMGVEPVLFDASLVSAQSRKRLFWTNIPFDLPQDRGLLMKDILQDIEARSYVLTPDRATKPKDLLRVGYIGKSKSQSNRVYSQNSKSPCLNLRSSVFCETEKNVRQLTPVECERLQGLRDDYTAVVTKTNRYKCLGNAFNVDVVATILLRTDHARSPASRADEA